MLILTPTFWLSQTLIVLGIMCIRFKSPLRHTSVSSEQAKQSLSDALKIVGDYRLGEAKAYRSRKTGF